MSSYLDKPATPQEALQQALALEHAGVKGMKWGQRKASSSSGSSSKKSSKQPRFSAAQLHVGKKVAFSVAVVGASVAASMVVGPVGAMAVSGIGRALDGAITVKTESTMTGPGVPTQALNPANRLK